MRTLSIRSLTLFVASVTLLAAGCNSTTTTDAGTDAASHPDLGTTDLGTTDLGATDLGATDLGTVDMGHDAGPTATHSGLISVSDVQVAGIPALGHGGKITIGFSPLAGGPTPTAFIDHRGVLGNGCVGAVYAAADIAAVTAGVDEGSVAITGAAATIPPCTFVATAGGYVCIGASGMGATTVTVGGTVPAGAALYTVAGTTFTAADVGRYFSISGDATNAVNNGAFPIVGQLGAAGVIVGNPVAVAVATPFTGTFATVAGQGPVPSATGGPDFLNAGDMVTVALTAGGGMHFPSFTSGALTAPAPFTLLTGGTSTSIAAVPVDGTAITQGCDMTAGACDGLITAIAIDTTDGATAGLPPYKMPTATGHVAQIRCADFSTSVTVPADIMALVMTAAPTRVQTTVLRSDLFQTTDVNKTNVILGRGWVGFTTP